ncbi:WD40-repeat-containing subunit of the 18S rRNA processing complex [Ceraceosorus bombacis]|uniref:WD40-repeat-containing subunit of the 18S rRNA processing complex n=1 Tax=Ceraceosorus bombacis TaxID=401625 RepID=A0A0P1BID2_9BASI|nr:WD40-repeat-containing subunit of the 18S rRNA processing complex [Ceraceosorus bombacis]
MVRSYLRHEPTQAFGLVASSTSRSLLCSDGKTAVVPALEDVLIWDVKRGTQLSMWHDVGHKANVTAIARAPQRSDDILSTYAVGYQDGSIRIWRVNPLDTEAPTSPALTFNGHNAAVTSLAFEDQGGLRLASGSLDTDIILWDVVAETGMYRMKGHRNAITDLAFVPGTNKHDSQDAYKQPSSSSASFISLGHLVSASKDGLIKLWDLSMQHCLQTVVPGKGEILTLAMASGFGGKYIHQLKEDGASDRDDASVLLLTGSAEGEVRIWEIDTKALAGGIQASAMDVDLESTEDAGGGLSRGFIIPHGTLPVSSSRRITQILFAPPRGAAGCGFVAVMSSEKAVQVFRIRTQDDMRRKLARRNRRAREKAQKKSDGGIPTAATGLDDAGSNEPANAEIPWAERLESYTIVRPTQGRLRSFAFQDASENANSNAATPMLLALATNAIEVQSLPPPPQSRSEKATPPEATLSCGIDLPGHRSEARAVALSSDDTLLASADSFGQLKIWNVATGRCIRTLPGAYALTVAWLPGDRHVLVGCKDGTLRSYDIPAGEAVETIQAHDGPLWSIAVHPDGQSCVTASADKDVKFWEFESVVSAIEERTEDQSGPDQEQDEGRSAPSAGRMQLSLAHVRTLKMTDDVLFAKYSPDGRLLALSLLDTTVKVFFADSLKFFLSLYGHKLPVLSLDISSDSKLCLTVSADRNAKIWGLDYGDCHRSLFAHEEAVMGCAFEQGSQGGGLMGGKEGASHHFWTVGRDGRVRHWDGDRFELIQTLEGHHGEVWAVAAGHKGNMAVTAGADRSIRVWEKTEEPLFLEEEREREMEKLYETGAPAREDDSAAVGSLAAGAEAPQKMDDVGAVTKSTGETLKAGERLIEALEAADEDLRATKEWEKRGSQGAPPARSPVLLASFAPDEAVDPNLYVLRVTEKITAAQLDDALIVIPFDKVISLMRCLDHWAKKQWNIPLVARILFFLLRTHHAQIVANRVMRVTLASLSGHLRSALDRQKTTIGFNLAALRHVRAQYVAQRTSTLYERYGFDLTAEEVKARIEQGQKRKRKLAVS